jgi:hypothetical protein
VISVLSGTHQYTSDMPVGGGGGVGGVAGQGLIDGFGATGMGTDQAGV